MESWGTTGELYPFVNVYEVSIASQLLLTHILTIILIPAFIPAYYS